MNDDELIQFYTEACVFLPYVYWRKMLMAHYEFMEDLLHV